MGVLAVGVPIDDTANPLDGTADSIGNTGSDPSKQPASTSTALRFPALSMRVLRGRVRIA